MQSWREKSAEAIVDQTCRNKTNTPLIPAVKSHDVHGTRPANSVQTAQGRVRRTDTVFGRLSKQSSSLASTLPALFSELPKSAAFATGRSTNAQTDEK